MGFISKAIAVALTNFRLTFLLIGFLVSLVAIAPAPAPRSSALFYADVFMPLIGAALLWLHHRYQAR